MLSAVIDIAGAIGANELGGAKLADGSPTKIAAHALLGGLKSMAMGGDFQTGAIAGGANEALAQYLAKLVLPEGYDPGNPGAEQAKANLLAMTQLVAVLTTVVTGGDPGIAANIAANATQYNYLSHSDLERAANRLVGCGKDADCAITAYTEYHNLSTAQTKAAFIQCGESPAACADLSKVVAKAQADTAMFRSMADEAPRETRGMLNQLIAENDGFQNDLAGMTAGHSAEAVAETLAERFNVSPEKLKDFTVGVILTVAALAAAKGVVSAVGAKAAGEVASSGGKPTVELFGGQKAQTPGAINVDIRPDIQSGIRADATKLPFGDNSLGEVVASNPFIPKSVGGTNSMMDFLPEATRVVEPGGKIFINANAANPYGKIPSASELESLGLRVIQNGPLDSRFSGQTFLRTDGSVITNLDSMKTVVLEKFK